MWDCKPSPEPPLLEKPFGKELFPQAEANPTGRGFISMGKEGKRRNAAPQAGLGPPVGPWHGWVLIPGLIPQHIGVVVAQPCRDLPAGGN